MKKKIMAVLLALAMVTQGAMPVFAQNEGAEGIETAADAETAKILCKEYLSEEQQIQGIDQRFEIPQEDVSFVNDLGSGTITLSFKTGSKFAGAGRDQRRQACESLHVFVYQRRK